MSVACPNCGHVLTTGRPSLTTRQTEVLAVIHQYFAEKGRSPAHREIADALGLRSLATVHEHLRGLVAKGYIACEYNRQQSITLLPAVLLGAPAYAAGSEQPARLAGGTHP